MCISFGIIFSDSEHVWGMVGHGVISVVSTDSLTTLKNNIGIKCITLAVKDNMHIKLLCVIVAPCTIMQAPFHTVHNLE